MHTRRADYHGIASACWALKCSLFCVHALHLHLLLCCKMFCTCAVTNMLAVHAVVAESSVSTDCQLSSSYQHEFVFIQLQKATTGQQQPASTHAYVQDLRMHALASDEQLPAVRQSPACQPEVQQQLAASLAEFLGTPNASPFRRSQCIHRNLVGTQLMWYRSWHDMAIKEDTAVKGVFMQPVHAYAKACEISDS